MVLWTCLFRWWNHSLCIFICFLLSFQNLLKATVSLRPRTSLNSRSSSSLDDDSSSDEEDDEDDSSSRRTITLVLVPRFFRCWCCSRRLSLVATVLVRADTLGDSSEALEAEAEGGGPGGNNDWVTGAWSSAFSESLEVSSRGVVALFHLVLYREKHQQFLVFL